MNFSLTKPCVCYSRSVQQTGTMSYLTICCTYGIYYTRYTCLDLIVVKLVCFVGRRACGVFMPVRACAFECIQVPVQTTQEMNEPLNDVDSGFIHDP